MKINLKIWFNKKCPRPLVFYVAREKSKVIFLLFCHWPDFPIFAFIGFFVFLIILVFEQFCQHMSGYRILFYHIYLGMQ